MSLDDEIKTYDDKTEEFKKYVLCSNETFHEYKQKSNAFDNYSNFCYRTAKLIINLAGEFQDDKIYFTIYNYLYRNGYLSINKSFSFGIDENEILQNCGLSVISSLGVCRNISSLFKDILKEIYKIKVVKNKGIVFIGTNLKKEDIVIPINEMCDGFKMKIDKSYISLSNDKKTLFLPNHAEILVYQKKENGFSFEQFDPTTFRILFFDINKETKYTSKRNAMDIRLDINYDEPIEKQIKNIELLEIILPKFEKVSKTSYNRYQLEVLMEYVKRRCEKQEKMLKDFYIANSFLYKVLVDQKMKYNETKKKPK